MKGTLEKNWKDARARLDLGMSVVNYIPMTDICPRDLGMSLENYIPMTDICPRDLGMSLPILPSKSKKRTNMKGTLKKNWKDARARLDLGMSVVNYIPMTDICPRDLGMSLENYIPMTDICPRDLGMSLPILPSKSKKRTNQKWWQEGRGHMQSLPLSLNNFLHYN